MSKALTIAEVAERAQLHHSTIRSEINAGRLKAWRVGGKARGAIRIEQEDFEAWKHRGKVTALPTTPPSSDDFSRKLRAVTG